MPGLVLSPPAFSLSLLLALFSLAVRDSLVSFAIVWAASFVVLWGFEIWLWGIAERSRLSRSESLPLQDTGFGTDARHREAGTDREDRA
jgi:hypothetical protein